MIKKKILIAGTIILIIGFCIFDFFIIRFIRNKENIKTSSDKGNVSQVAEKNFDIDVKITDEIVESVEANKETESEKTEEEKQEDVTVENQQQTTNNTVATQQSNNVKTSNVENKITKTESQPTTTQKQETKSTNTTKTNTNSNTTNNNNNNNNQTSTQTTNTQATEQPKVQEQQSEPVQQTQAPKEETKPVQEVVPAQPTREVRRNDAMIQKMKTYISTHETERMKKYGYSFVVDSSITQMTHPFTYSEYNMQTCLDLTGQIYIYAQDYYINGQYMETQCYVY